MLEVTEFEDEKPHIDAFLLLPKLLYKKKYLTQNENEEKQLLTNTHILGKYFTLKKFVAYENDRVCGRFILTFYPNEANVYIGLFECEDNSSVANALFAAAEKCAVKNGRKSIIGPVDASFWIKYRLKTNSFNRRAYVGEPYNKDYYLRLFSENGFAVSENYVSTVYDKFPLLNYRSKKCSKRYDKFTAKGYRIVSPKLAEWDTVIGEVYRLIIELYSDFPVFRFLTEDDFRELFKSYRYILDFSMVQMAYCNDEAVGFFIALPDYKNRLYGKLNLLSLLYVALKKIRSSNYIMLYLGVDRKHRGLGTAMTARMIDGVHRRRATSVGAFIRKGKVTESYVGEHINNKYEYVLLKKDLI